MPLVLGRRNFPETTAEFENALKEGAAVFHSPRLQVEVSGELPNFQRLAIDLSDGTIPRSLPTGRSLGSKQQAELKTGKFELAARPLRVGSGCFELELRAEDVDLVLQQGINDAMLLDLAGAKSGDLQLEASRKEIEAIILDVANDAAEEKGVTVQSVDLTVESSGPRSVSFRADVAAKKLFMQATITLSGSLAIDEGLNARLSDLNCSGSGMIGGLACGFLQPYLEKFGAQPIPLTAFNLGNLRVRDLTLDAGEPLRVRATFGGPA